MSNFWDLVNIEQFGEKRETFIAERWEVAFYCKDCEALVGAERKNPKWYVFICPTCTWENISIWTQEWLKENYFRK